MSEVLNNDLLKRLPGDVRVPGDRPGNAGVLHIGAGAFHRAHQAVYTDDTDWGITVAAPRSRDVIDALAAQDGLFSVATLGPEGASMRVVGAIVDTLHIATERERALDLIAADTTHVVTLTVTEKAYRDPEGVPGLLAAGLARRAARGGPPLTILCCDNLPDNGKTTRAAVEPLLDPATRAWADEHVTFPSSMVDRIVPASTTATYDRALAGLGVTDLAAVEAEPFSQWVIEDDFAGPRPDWNATFTNDVAGWERLKLRTLNGVHSALAYLGALADVETISETLALPGAEDFARWLISEQIAPSFAPPDGQDTVAYGEDVLERFANPGIRHRCLQIAMDGSQKLPQRLFATIADLADADVARDLIALPLAAWTRFCSGRSDAGAELPLDDPLGDVIRRRLAAAGPDPAARIDAILGFRQIVPEPVADDHQLRRAAAKWLRELDRHGVATTLEHL
ncbi:mannitol dehydrogenase family protein [Glycomyces sp. TRM65418]|uniref:mannitol dehydrogenase family protein n=1 Tax=Glycomyces sp. TRM65418 TaxID=2867006 RepID=UPI001CE5528F|nr:mannitol dehydrogenase family protein [Glycomyces sp. TRM65418]MCC3762227.1 mannitol dehydrogenase family protein [Glycomyces sp. TRM65418]QZD56286.1 mannitol dehydrogenase family protein [Glycomyces sp. TRM65418]